jgi:hypothetical protein
MNAGGMYTWAIARIEHGFAGIEKLPNPIHRTGGLK